MNKKQKKILAVVLVIICLLLAVAWFVGDYFVGYALERKPLDDFDPLAPSYEMGEIEQKNKDNINALVDQWLVEVDPVTVNLTATDGTPLHGLVYNNNDSDLWVIAVHGYTSIHTAVDDIAYNYYNKGYNAITPDLRGHGYSGGQYMTMGYNDSEDLLLWIDYILEINPNAEIVLHGVSMGAATVMITAGDDKLPENVIAVVEDCGYTNAFTMMEEQIEFRFGLPSFPLVDIANIVSQIKTGLDIRDASPIESLENAEVPILFIHGDQDGYVQFYMLDELYNSYDGIKEKLVIEGADHGGARNLQPEQYYNTVFNFIDNI